MSYIFKYEPEGGGVINRYPMDTDTVIWIVGDSLKYSALIASAQKKWGSDMNLDDLVIDSVHHLQYNIHNHAYESTDYVNYIVLSYNKDKKCTV